MRRISKARHYPESVRCSRAGLVHSVSPYSPVRLHSHYFIQSHFLLLKCILKCFIMRYYCFFPCNSDMHSILTRDEIISYTNKHKGKTYRIIGLGSSPSPRSRSNRYVGDLFYFFLSWFLLKLILLLIPHS